MNEKRITTEPEQIQPSEESFWDRSAIRALADCLSIERTPEFCAHMAADVADAMVRERRLRVNR
jgi:hypothetical protein